MSSDPEDTFAKLQAAIQAALLATTRTTNAILAQDLPFLRSLDPNVAALLDAQHARLLSLAEQLLANAAAGTAVANPRLTDADALESGWTGIVDVLDGLLERADTCLDGFEAARAREAAQPSGAIKQQVAASANGEEKPKKNWEKVPRNLDIPKPQRLFESQPDLRSAGARVFTPLLSRKPWARQPLEESLKERVPATTHGLEDQVAHPYQIELEAYEFPDSVRDIAGPIPYSDFDTTSATFVDTPEAFDEMLAELKEVKEVAVDLEHHDTRSYIGIVSLMQISTRSKDWVIDTLLPWRRRLELLNEVFANPSILKVFQGSHSDIIWLQRDFGLYIVGLFDTHHAARALKYPGASLAFLLSKFCNFNAQKQYQTADWRIRPLPQVMLDYARSDTHFLLYIHDNMRNELIEASKHLPAEEDLLTVVQQKSKEECLQRYELPVYDMETGLNQNGWYRLLARTPALFSKEQFSVYRAVHAWRDMLARDEDESTAYIMSNHSLMTIARELPTDRVVLFRVAAPVSQPVRLRVDELITVISNAKAAGADGEEMRDIMAKVENIDVTFRKKRQRQIPQEFARSQEKPKSDEGASFTPVVAGLAKPLDVSQLWGSIPNQNHTLPLRAVSGVELSLPLPDLTAEVFEPGTLAVQSPPLPNENSFVAKQDRAVVDGADDVFIVKQLGGRTKRKRAADAGSVDGDLAAPTNNSNTSTPVPDDAIDAEDEAMIRERRKAAKEQKKAAKAAARAAAAAEHEFNGAQPESANGDVVSVDYASQPSLLQGLPREKTGKYKKPKKGAGPFDMYSKAADAPKGLGRSQKERGGKQATFSQ